MRFTFLRVSVGCPAKSAWILAYFFMICKFVSKDTTFIIFAKQKNKNIVIAKKQNKIFILSLRVCDSKRSNRQSLNFQFLNLQIYIFSNLQINIVVILLLAIASTTLWSCDDKGSKLVSLRIFVKQKIQILSLQVCDSKRSNRQSLNF